MAGLDAQGIQQVAGMIQGFALKIVGGVPILKNLRGSTNELLKLPKHLDIGNVGNVLQQVMQNGLGSLIQNPLAQVAGQAQAALSQAQAAVGALGSAGAGLSSALGSLQASVSSAASLAGSLSGLSPAAGLPSQLDLVSHAGSAASFGDGLPAAFSVATAAAPLLMGPQIASIGAQAAALANAAVSGSISPAAAAVSVAGLQSAVDSVVNGSVGAITGLQAHAPDFATAATAVASLAPGAVPADLATAMQACIVPGMLPTLLEQAADYVADVRAAAAATS